MNAWRTMRSCIHREKRPGKPNFPSFGRITADPEVIPKNAVMSGWATNRPDLAALIGENNHEGVGNDTLIIDKQDPGFSSIGHNILGHHSSEEWRAQFRCGVHLRPAGTWLAGSRSLGRLVIASVDRGERTEPADR